MIFNNSMLRFNVTFKGREYGFAPYETKKLIGKMTEKEEQQLANKYTFLIYKPNLKKDIKKEEEKKDISNVANSNKLEEKIKEKIVNNGTPDIPLSDPEPVIGEHDKYSTVESVIIAEKETIVIKEDDIIDVVEGVENIPLDSPVKKEHQYVDITSDEIEDDIEDDIKEEIVDKKSEPKKKTTKKTPKKTNKKK